jgi:carboxypeptidase C (cathepsin A)
MQIPRAILAFPLLAAAFGALTALPAAQAQTQEQPTGTAASSAPAQDELVLREHTAQLAGGALKYTSQAGRIVLRTEAGKPRASVFHVYYRAKPDVALANRPITFCFNGGPGSSSVWLHLGAFGPRRIDMGPDGFDLDPPYAVSDNAWSILHLTDLVFIDPVTTGFSRAAEEVDDGEFHGLSEDVESVGEFIRLFLTREQRWASPVYLAGESYGTTRAARLARHLQERHGIYPTGLVLVSAILNFQTARFDVGNDLPFALFLPTYAAIGWYHGRVDRQRYPDLETLLREAEAYAAGDYTLALMRGDRLSADERDEVAGRLAELTGLDTDYLHSTDLRIHIGRFVKELRRGEQVTVGRLDGRYTGTDLDSAGERYEYDPSYAAIQGPYSMALNQYVRAELGFESDLPYEILTGRVHPWSYRQYENSYVNVAEDLRRAMSSNRTLEVYVANGYYDLATPYFATQYTFDHLSLAPELQDQIHMGYFESGHMMYVRRPDAAKLTADLEAFYRR